MGELFRSDEVLVAVTVFVAVGILLGVGIGRLLMQHILAEAEKEIQGLKIIRLGVFANNPVALEMYKSLGFVELGNLPNGLLHKGEYVAHIYMYKVL